MQSNLTRDSILVFGAGGHAQSVISAVDHGRQFSILGLLQEQGASDIQPGSSMLGYPVLGGFDVLDRFLWQANAGVALAVGDNDARARIGMRLCEMGGALCTVVHDLACVTPSSQLGAGSFVHAFAHIGAGAVLGTGTIVSSHCTVGHGSVIGDWAHLTPGVRLGGNVRIGEGVLLGMGCAILPGVTVGPGASVGANTVVHKDIPAGAVVVGNPARTIKGGARA